MKYFINLSTRTKLFVGFGTIWLMLAIVVYIAYQGFTEITQSEKELHERYFTETLDLRSLRSHQNYQAMRMLEMMLSTKRSDQEAKERDVRKRNKEIDAVLERLVKVEPDTNFQNRLQELKNILGPYRQTREKTISLIYQGKREEAKTLRFSLQEQREEMMRAIATELGDKASSNIDQQLAVDMQQAGSAILLFLILGAMALLFGIAMVVLLNKTFVKSLNGISEIAARIAAKNDLEIAIPADDRTDEVGTLTQAFRLMVENLRRSTVDISESKRLEQEMRAASLYARNLIEASLDPLVTISSEGKITDVNKTTEQVTGVSRERLTGSDFADYFTEPDKARAGYKQVFSQGTVKDYPLTIRHSSGRATDVLYNASVYKNEAGEVQGVFAAARDITERKKKDEQLRVASLYARNLIEASLDPLVTISADGKITDVNKTTEQVTGMPRERLIGSDFADYFTEPDKARAGYKQVFSQGIVKDYPLTLRHNSGKTIDVLYNASIYKNEAGEVQGIFAAARDITERNQAEESIRKLSHQNKLILDSLGEGVYGVDSSGKATFVNPATVAMTGYTMEELVGRTMHEILHHTKPDGTPYPPQECPIYAASKDGAKHRVMDEVFWRKDGTSFPVEYVATAIQEQGKSIGAVVIFKDITERKRVDEELTKYREQLEGMVKQRTAALTDVLSKVKDTVNVLAASSSEIMAATTQVASSTAENASAISETTTTVEEARQAAQLSSQKAKNVSGSAQRVDEVSRTGQKAVEETASGMRHIHDQMESIAQTIVRLSEQSQSIGGIIASVSDLADQSNLLAVNAAIEAAKAGEQGKGFAVVAQEIKSLSEQSKQATAQVRGILSDVQKATSAAVMATERGSKAVEAGVKQSEQAGEAIRVLAESSQVAVQTAMQIVASSQQQMVGMDQIGTAMKNINQAGAQNATSVRQAETAAKNLHELGLKLKGLVEQFNV